MEKKGWVSIWFGNFSGNSIGEYVDLGYDDDGESIPSQFFKDFKIDMDETDEDTIEKAVYNKSSNEISFLLNGCSYEEIILPKIQEICNIKKSYNAVILIYNFEYKNNITSAGNFDFVSALKYE
ncbi:hypothetical protein FZC76_05855 [Sutcliffiella horikoshii]|uniref:Immunity 22 family protein n=1 Tax=Sutcliffiella horikoshii TaxID=79883 RepID=A0A5D4T245_9BACI|nr:immunity 22 family protein [Sutcliffiella horikoshii]TYS69757.1 hypothetical protein FZC76_05855 [Sutcliffiella horikoshii]